MFGETAGNLADIDLLYRTVKDQKGHIDVLYASAGQGEFNLPLGKISEESFDKTFDLGCHNGLGYPLAGSCADRYWGSGRPPHY